MQIKRLFLKNRIIIAFLLQLATIFFSQILAIGFTSDFERIFDANIFLVITISLLARAIFLYFYKLHHGLWRYTSFSDILKTIKSATLGSVIYLIGASFIFSPVQLLNIVIVDWVFVIFFLTGIRLVSRLIRETKFSPRKQHKNTNKQKRLVIVGAGDAGINLCRNIQQNQKVNYEPIAFADDDKNKIGSRIQDIPVAGKINELPSIVSRFNVEKAVLAIPSATPKQKSIVIETLNNCGIEFEILPSTPDVLAGNVSTNKIREVNPLDILGRLPTKLNPTILNKFINDKCILITGAGGSVGSDLARQTTKYNPQTLIILDQIENPLLFLESEIKYEYPEINLITLIADVTDKHAIGKILSTYKF